MREEAGGSVYECYDLDVGLCSNVHHVVKYSPIFWGWAGSCGENWVANRPEALRTIHLSAIIAIKFYSSSGLGPSCTPFFFIDKISFVVTAQCVLLKTKYLQEANYEVILQPGMTRWSATNKLAT